MKTLGLGRKWNRKGKCIGNERLKECRKMNGKGRKRIVGKWELGLGMKWKRKVERKVHWE